MSGPCRSADVTADCTLVSVCHRSLLLVSGFRGSGGDQLWLRTCRCTSCGIGVRLMGWSTRSLTRSSHTGRAALKGCFVPCAGTSHGPDRCWSHRTRPVRRALIGLRSTESFSRPARTRNPCHSVTVSSGVRSHASDLRLFPSPAWCPPRGMTGPRPRRTRAATLMRPCPPDTTARSARRGRVVGARPSVAGNGGRDAAGVSRVRVAARREAEAVGGSVWRGVRAGAA
ncbi:hypothetical protein SacazDRAFT_04262 [Saccharomonospora azurea NA-128]|uniref:Uncharacterized protein n=1 Tax=Saccharomonospora azurea NA-128 TaxID=882081 RepID=H8GFS3_9PSEU|nr:hypothetical protein SacazDRAFT_04262 [Saccharomonospora azurea NA-128]